MWEIRISHEGLHTYRVVRGSTKEEAELRARLQRQAWETRWARKLAAEAALRERLKKKNWADRQTDIDKRAKNEAMNLTRQAEAELIAAKNLLSKALSQNHTFDWKSLRDTSFFTRPEPPTPELNPLPLEPLRTDAPFKVEPVIATIRFIDWVLPSGRKKKQNDVELLNRNRTNEAERRFKQTHLDWKERCEGINRENENVLANHQKAKAAWALDKQLFYERQKQFNIEVEELEKEYFNRSEQALKRYCAEVLARSAYPEQFPKDCLVSFDPQRGVLVVDYELPPQHVIPNVKGVKYSTTRQEFQKTLLSDAESRRLYDEILYQICIRSLYELFQADQVDMIKTIVFNGWVDAIDKATGADTHPCIMTVQVNKREFMALNLSQIDLKVCFRSLKGISGSKLVDFSPVRAVLSLNREDPRFVNSYNVVGRPR